MNSLPILSIVTFLPLLFGIAILFLPKSQARIVAMAGTIVTLLVSLLCIAGATSSITAFPESVNRFEILRNSGGFNVVEIAPWIQSLHLNYTLGLDGISLLMVLMTTVIFPFAVGASFNSIDTKETQYYFWIMLMETAILGVFLSINLILFYVFWEAMLIPMYFIIGMWGGSKRIYATIKFFLYTMAGSMIMLVSIIGLYIITGSVSFDLPVIQARLALNGLPAARELLLFLGFFFAFGIKAPVWPFHTWAPDAYAESPTGGTIILVALKMGLYGFIRFCIPLFPHAMNETAPVIVTLSFIGVVYCALVAAVQKDLKRLLAYSSISHIGVIMLAIFAMNKIAISGALIQMVSHTITTGALFILVGALYARRKSYLIEDYGGLMKVMPAFTAVFLIAVLSSVALPTTAGFTGEILMLIGAFQKYPVPTGIATTSAIWSVVYMLWMFQRVMYGPLNKEENQSLPDWKIGEKWALTPLILLIFAIGIYPKPILDSLSGPIDGVLQNRSNIEVTTSDKIKDRSVYGQSPESRYKTVAFHNVSSSEDKGAETVSAN